MSLKVEKLAQDTFEQLETKRKISRLEREKAALFERVIELANDVSEKNIEAYLTVNRLNEAIADLQSG